MFAYRVTVSRNGTKYVYPVPDARAITAIKYERLDLSQAVILYPDRVEGEGVTAIEVSEFEAVIDIRRTIKRSPPGAAATPRLTAPGLSFVVPKS